MTLYKEDVVAVTTEAGVQLLDNARPLKATINESSKSFEHPVEDGSTIVDDKVNLPIEIQLPVVLDPSNFRNVYAQIKQYFITGELFTIQTKSGIYPNMYLTSIPHDESADIADTISMALSFKEAIIVEAQFGTLPLTQVADPENSSTVDRGEQNGVERSAAAALIAKVSGWLGG